MSERLLIRWKELKALGWPYSRSQTWRLMKAGKFVQAQKLVEHCNSPPLWPYAAVLAYFKEHGLVECRRRLAFLGLGGTPGSKPGVSYFMSHRFNAICNGCRKVAKAVAQHAYASTDPGYYCIAADVSKKRFTK
jgi:hypothetical protein